MKEMQVTGKDAKQRFDKYLKRCFPEMGTSFLYKMLRKKNITLNGKKATGSEQVLEGDKVQCFFSDETFAKFSGDATSVESNHFKKTADGNLQPENNSNRDLTKVKSEYTEYRAAFHDLKGIAVIYEDEHLLLLNKPAGILSQKAGRDDFSLNEWMLGYLLEEGVITEDSLRRFKPSVCNRLDRNTSGLVICGKTLIGSREMSRMLKDRSLQKYYRTYVYGKMEGKETLIAYHKKDSGKNQAEIRFSVPEAKKKEYDEIITSYETLVAKKDYSYLEIELITGKTHQIRAHLAACGHPIVGDPKYGADDSMKKSAGAKNGIEKNVSGAVVRKLPKYQLLHAYRIVFPVLEGELAYLSGKEFVCEEPDAFQSFRKHCFW